MIETALVCGAGIGGLTVAIAMAQRDIKVEIYEKSAKLCEVGAGIQLSPNAMNVLNGLGLGGLIEEIAFEPDFACIRHYETGKELFSSPLKSVCRQRYGAPYFHVHRADFHGLLVRAAEDLGVKIHLNSHINSYSQDIEKIKLKYNNTISNGSNILIGADGIHSIMQKQMQGSQAVEFTNQIAWRGTIPAQNLPAALNKPGTTVWRGPKRHLVTYNIRGGDLINFVAVEERNEWFDESWVQKGSAQELKSSYKDWHPNVVTLLDAVEETFVWGLFDRPELSKWSDGRAVLLGDACHPTLPFMAQGAAMAIEDAYVLAELISTPNTQYKEAFQTYEHIRKPRTTKLQQKARANISLFHIHGGIEDWATSMKFFAASFLPKNMILKPLDFIYSYNYNK